MDLREELERLLPDTGVEPDTTGALVILHEKMQGLDPLFLFVADAKAGVLACHQCKGDVPWRWRDCYPAAVTAALRRQSFVQVRIEDEGAREVHVLGFKATAPDGAAGVVGVLLEAPPPRHLLTPDWHAELDRLAHLVWIAVYGWRDGEVAKTRVRHLQSEKAALERELTAAVAEALEEHDRRLRDREQRISSLETEVADQMVQLEQALREARAASDAKTTFLANMSHEIRTPMTAILGFADILLDGVASAEEQRAHVETIRRNGEHLLTVINDILDLSKIEAGKMPVEDVAFDPWELVRDTVGLLERRATEGRIELRLERGTGVPALVRSDPTRLRQILLNLLSNAIKFTRAGAVTVSAWLDDNDPAAPRLWFEVADTGVGIAPDRLEAIFEPFTQGDDSAARRHGGTGLGLTICRRLAALLGGRIEVESRLGHGSVFRFWVPVGAPVARPEPDAAAPAPDRFARRAPPAAEVLDGRILLAEDGDDNQRLIAHILRSRGAVVHVARDGREAVDMVRLSLVDEQPFDLVLMDLQMPELDGYAATRVLRQMGYDRPIIALTAHAMPNDHQRCLEAGCDGFQTKPIDRQKLLETVGAQLARGRAGAAPVGGPREGGSA